MWWQQAQPAAPPSHPTAQMPIPPPVLYDGHLASTKWRWPMHILKSSTNCGQLGIYRGNLGIQEIHILPRGQTGSQANIWGVTPSNPTLTHAFSMKRVTHAAHAPCCSTVPPTHTAWNRPWMQKRKPHKAQNTPCSWPHHNA